MNPAEARRERIARNALVVLAIVACLGWWYGYVRPRDEYIREVIACTRDGSRAEYARCSDLVRTRLTAPE